MPDYYPDYPSHWLMAEYFENYARWSGVYAKVRFNTTVSSITLLDKGTWRVESFSSENSTTDVFDVLIVCNGHHWNPRYPNYPGKFEGEMIHSHYFKSNRPFAGKRVMVIGAGNSGCDAAVELSRVAKRTFISMRRGYHFIPKFVFGQPADVIANRFQWVPDFLLDKVYDIVLRLENGDVTKWGLKKPDHGVRQSHPVSNSELLYYIRHGEITAKPDVEKFEGKTVYFKDGTREELDVVIAATGFKVTFPFFENDFINFQDTDVRLFKRIFHPVHRHLMFVGLIQASGCFWKLADYQSKLLANYLCGNYPLPHNMNTSIDDEVQTIRKQFTISPRHLIEVDYFKYARHLISQIPRNAPAWRQ